MELQRLYSDDNTRIVGIRVVNTGLSREQNFRRGLIEEGVVEGWVKLDGDTLTLNSQPESLVYTVVRAPGYYATYGGQRIPISNFAWSSPGRDRLAAAEAKAWLSAQGLPPSYEVVNAYECVLNEAQHEKFRGVRSPSGRLVAAYEQQE